jgi:hypothetical protein
MYQWAYTIEGTFFIVTSAKSVFGHTIMKLMIFTLIHYKIVIQHGRLISQELKIYNISWAVW